MNGRERVLATVNGESADRRAFSAMLSLYGAKLTDCPLEQHYTDPAAYARGQAAVREVFQPDILFGPFCLVSEGEAFGSKAKFFDHQPPNLWKPAIASAEDISSLRIPDVDSHPRLLYLREALCRIKRDHGKEVVVAAVLLSPVDLPIMVMGLDRWLDTILFDKDGTRRMLDITGPHFIQWANALLCDGADILAMPAAFMNPSVVTRQIVEELTIPFLSEAFAEVKGPVLVHHAGAPFLEFLDLYAALPGVVGFVMDPRDRLSAAREKAGAEAVLLGGLDAPDLAKMSVEEVEERCREILEDRRDDRRYILTTSGPDVALNTPRENIHAMRWAVESFGKSESHG